jgi:aldose sugar dehydrogenase
MFLNKLSKLYIIAVITVSLVSCKDDRNLVPDGTNPEWPKDSIRVVKDGLNQPWEILWGKDDYIWVTERNGKISKINPLNGSVVSSWTISGIVPLGEGGLLGMVQDPDFLQNGYFYIVHNYYAGSVYKERVRRLTYDKNAGTISSPFTLIDTIAAASIHDGSRLLITPDKKLLVTTGDAAVPNNAQNLGSRSGKILRTNLDKSIPTDNPSSTSYVWSYGHRNPQGIVYVNGKLYASEHGPNTEDEINIIEKGGNYGWPNVVGPCDGSELAFCSANNIKQPLYSSGNVTLAYSSIDYYNYDLIPAFKNKLLLATLKNQSVEVLTLNADGSAVTGVTPYFKNKFGRIRDICISPEGRVYICTGNGGNADKIIEIQKL